MSPPPGEWLAAFLFTCAIELPIYAALLGPHFRRKWAPVALGLFVNLLTHPALWYVMPRWSPYGQWLVCAEGGVVAVEALLIAGVLARRLGVARALAWGAGSSLIANAASTLVGLALQRLDLM